MNLAFPRATTQLLFSSVSGQWAQTGQRMVRTIFSSKSSGSGKSFKEGDTLPNDSVLVENDPMKKLCASEIFGQKKAVMFGVPGAYTPGCSSKHVPSYLNRHGDFQKKGVATIACLSVNDPFVMQAWARELKTEGKIRMLADPQCKFTKAIKMEKDFTELLGNWRSKRFAMIINNGKVVKMFVEPDGTGVTCTMADNVLKALTEDDQCAPS
ncbi:peroxiredoxin-5, mitochondrial-like [Paramacrobiotus metropolitanus]|uniref:peroxiredoxin-5, mitochondrial-like n=1 Tax=Paramacrobiotus metropolitanus TaxID=2943436 RepID=UPI0024461968|nr:peroxiredoxin-5, mitochondrial-like [Paramacrobiotus metropolitanus]